LLEGGRPSEKEGKPSGAQPVRLQPDKLIRASGLLGLKHRFQLRIGARWRVSSLLDPEAESDAFQAPAGRWRGSAYPVLKSNGLAPEVFLLFGGRPQPSSKALEFSQRKGRGAEQREVAGLIGG